MLFAIFLKSLNVSLHQLNSKNNDPVLLFTRIFKHCNCFLSSVATDGKDGHVLKLFITMSAKITKKIIVFSVR